MTLCPHCCSFFAAGATLLLAFAVVNAADYHPIAKERSLSASASIITYDENNRFMSSSLLRAVSARRASRQMSANSHNQSSNRLLDQNTQAPAEDPWEAGTHVYKDFGTEGWWHGVIFDFQNDVYTVIWDDDSTSTYAYDSEIDADVENAANYVPYSVGTPVVQDSHSGSIAGYENWIYTITWADGTTQQYDNIDEVNAMVDAAGGMNDTTSTPTETEAPSEDPWGVGTHVYKDFGTEGWWHGVISEFQNDVYTVIWDDDSTSTYAYDSEIDADVENAANYVPYSVGTPVVQDSHSGSIAGYENWIYTITWADGTTQQYDNIDEVNAMVDAAGGMNDTTSTPTETEAPSEDPWGVGTHVYKDFGDEGWWHGVISEFQNDFYTVIWDDDSTSTYAYDSEIDADVENAANYVPYSVGTPVVQDSHSGSIAGYENWIYTITWADGTTQQYDNIDEVNAMVDAGESGSIPPTNEGSGLASGTIAPTISPKDGDTEWTNPVSNQNQSDEELAVDNGGASPGLKFGIVTLVLSVAIFAIVVIRRRSAKRKRQRAELICEEYKDDLELPQMD